MSAWSGTVARSVTWAGCGAAAFVGIIMALPEPAPPAATGDPGPEVSFAIEDVTVFDGEAFRSGQDVWVENGRIRRVGQRLALPPDLARVDGSGRTLVPGLVDGHVHTFGSTLNDAVRFGVTTVLDQFADPELVASKRAARDTLARGDEADLFSAGMLATAAGGHGTQYGVAVEPLLGPSEAPGWVRARKEEGSDWIKIVREDGSTFGIDIATLDRETVGALIAAARAEGLRAVVHVSTLDHALDAVALGADGLVHVWGDALVDEAQAARIADAGVFVVPTLSVRISMGGDAMEDELLEAVGDVPLSPMQRQTLASRFTGGGAEGTSEAGEVALENVRRLHAAGVRLLAGTDAPNPGTAAGLSLHGELRLLRRAGLSSAEALAAATSVPAATFGLDDRGRIAEGRIADLVLVDGDLETDLSLSSDIVAVWKDGYSIDRSRVDEERAQVQPASPAPETTLIADFEQGVGASFGFGWQVTSDRLQGGESNARLSAERGALRVEGDIVAGYAFPWAGAIYFPGAQPMQPVDFSDREVLRFRTRGDGRAYIVMQFGAGAGMGIPPSLPFTATAEWTEVEIPLERFPTATPGIIGGLAFVAQAPPLGSFAFEIDDVEIR
jgi:imidazolonepropionase-like amidohydrolase